MKILIVTDQRIKEINGTFFCTENFFDIVKRFSTLGEIRLCAPLFDKKTNAANTYDSRLDEIVNRNAVKFIKKTFFFAGREKRNTLEKEVLEVDLVIGYLPSLSASVANSLAIKYRKKYLSYVVGCPWDALWNHGILGKILAPISYTRLRRTLKKSNYALYVTEHFLQKRYPCPGVTCGCSDVRIVNLKQEILDKRLIRLSELTEKSSLKIVTIANYSVKYKGQHFVIAALAQLKKMGITRYHYHLIGGGNKDRLELLAKSLDVSDLVHFEGVVPHNRIFEKLDEMHIYIQPSLQEGLPRSVVEAMSRGLLCICANTAAMPEMVEPEYVVARKSVNDIVNVLQNISTESLREQAVRNFNEAKMYDESVLNAKRNVFFEKVIIDCGRKNV